MTKIVLEYIKPLRETDSKTLGLNINSNLIPLLEKNRQRMELGLSDGTRDLTINSLTTTGNISVSTSSYHSIPPTDIMTHNESGKTIVATPYGVYPATVIDMHVKACLLNGSTMEQIVYYVFDNDAGNAIHGKLYKVTLSTGAITQIGTTKSTTSQSASTQILTDDFTDEVVDNSIYAYFIDFNFDAAGTNLLRACGATIKYKPKI